MSQLKYCQGPKCHTYHTKDRIRGPKGDKHYETRRRSSFYYGNNNFCSWVCLNDWNSIYIEQALDHFGRTTEAKHLTEQNAWYKSYDWDSEYENRTYVIRNGITKEQRPLTEEQYNDNNYTLNQERIT